MMRPLLLSCAALALTLAVPTLAWAQDGTSDGQGALLTTTSTTSTTAVAVAAGGITTTLVAKDDATTPSPEKREQRKRTTLVYLRHNPTAALAASALGARGAARDLAQLFGVRAAHLQAFARLLRGQRHRLKALLAHPDQIDMVRVDVFMRHIEDAMSRDRALRLDVTRLLSLEVASR